MTKPKVTLAQLVEAKADVQAAQRRLRDETAITELSINYFNALTKKASREVLSQFMREGHTFN